MKLRPVPPPSSPHEYTLLVYQRGDEGLSGRTSVCPGPFLPQSAASGTSTAAAAPGQASTYSAEAWLGTFAGVPAL